MQYDGYVIRRAGDGKFLDISGSARNRPEMFGLRKLAHSVAETYNRPVDPWRVLPAVLTFDPAAPDERGSDLDD
jgi:hypothetical protein